MTAQNSSDRKIIAYVSWPSAPLTESLVLGALETVDGIEVVHALPTNDLDGWLIQWATYDDIDHDRSHTHPARVLSSSYTFRKALIRKHYLSRSIHTYLVKHPDSSLRATTPHTWELELSFADELDDMWSDELWDLGQAMDQGTDLWWILKPGMADRGMGIRLFDTREALQNIFEGFDEDSDGAGEDDANETAVVTSQLRHFVIQEYIEKPLLLDPREAPLGDKPVPSTSDLAGHKFHLRVYCVATGALTVYFYTRILALFSSKPYTSPVPGKSDDEPIDLSPHLTNTSLQTERGEEDVRLFDELVGCHILSGDGEKQKLTLGHLRDAQDQIADALSEVFKAALETPVHFQPVPSSFELFGVDFLIAHEGNIKLQVKLLEVNAEPAIELTGPRLTWILEDLFKSIAVVTVKPFASEQAEVQDWKEGEIRHHLRKCLATETRGATGW